MMGRWKSRPLFLLVFSAWLLAAAPLPASAKSEFPGRETTPLDIAVDLIVVRPLSLVGTTLCTAFFIGSLPFTVWTEKRFFTALEILVVNPGKYTFVRPPGEF
ncbi:MAG: hypothetical protein GY849_21605 [Deltaproteobacteria bacterium]|nr:hypothetical protein [Deltaproteobacteria bacterium]